MYNFQLNRIRWRQMYTPEVKFIFKRRTHWSDGWKEIGDPVPEDTTERKLFSMWNVGRIAMVEPAIAL